MNTSIYETSNIQVTFFSISENCDIGESVTFKVIYNKQKYDVTFELDKTILDLKKHVQTLTGKRF